MGGELSIPVKDRLMARARQRRLVLSRRGQPSILFGSGSNRVGILAAGAKPDWANGYLGPAEPDAEPSVR